MNATPRPHATASANSVLRTRNSRRSSATSNRLIDAAMMTAARTGCGIAWTRPGTTRSIRSTSAAGDEAGQLGLRARTGRRPPCASRSCSPGSRRTGRRRGWPSRSRRAPGCRRPRSRLGRRSRRRSRSCRRSRRARSPRRRRRAAGCRRAATAGSVGIGNPCGRTPITETPCAARSSTIESAIATTTATRMPGVRGASRLRPRMIARLSRPMPSAQGFVWSRPWRNATASATRPLASVENPNSFGSWPMKITTARPARYPVRTGFESRSATKPEPGDAGADRDEPDEEREHPGEGDRLLLVAGGERQDRGRDHRSERRNRGRGRGPATARRGHRRRGRRRSCTAR